MVKPLLNWRLRLALAIGFTLVFGTVSIFVLVNVPLKDLDSLVPKPHELAGRSKTIDSASKMTTAVVVHRYSKALMRDEVQRLEKELVQGGFRKSVGVYGISTYSKRYPGLMPVTTFVAIDVDSKVSCSAVRDKW